jgi:hypothetical protein
VFQDILKEISVAPTRAGDTFGVLSIEPNIPSNISVKWNLSDKNFPTSIDFWLFFNAFYLED